MKNKELINVASKYMEKLFPNARCELNYSKDYELLIAVILSAQTTDVAVNNVTNILFRKYPTFDDFYHLEINDIENEIKSLGLYSNKAKNIYQTIHILKEKFNGIVPSDEKYLISLPGVGNKTAGVVRAEFFKIPDLPVDTHISRISKRLGFASLNDNPDQIETKLKKLIPEEKWISMHHTMIHFGRYFCSARNPRCTECELKKYCKSNIN